MECSNKRKKELGKRTVIGQWDANGFLTSKIKAYVPRLRLATDLMGKSSLAEWLSFQANLKQDMSISLVWCLSKAYHKEVKTNFSCNVLLHIFLIIAPSLGRHCSVATM